jgi:Domain of unknown function (DUF5655)
VRAVTRDPPKHPLWRCPKCGHRFVTANVWHACGRYRLADHFRGKPAVVRQTFNAFVRLARKCGPVTVYAQKTRIVIQARVRFAGGVPHRDHFRAALWLKLRARHRCLSRVESFGSLGYGHYFRLESPADVDGALGALMREAYVIGRQESVDLAPNMRAPSGPLLRGRAP